MTESTKRKLSKWIPDAFVLDMLEASGILYPTQVQNLSDDELARAGLKVEEITAVREKLPTNVMEESKAE